MGQRGVGQTRLRPESVPVESGGGREGLLVLLAQPGVGEALGGVGRLLLAAEDGRQFGVEFDQADLTTAEGGETLAKAALERMGGVDILAHVIGGSASPGGGFLALTDDHWLA